MPAGRRDLPAPGGFQPPCADPQATRLTFGGVPEGVRATPGTTLFTDRTLTDRKTEHVGSVGNRRVTSLPYALLMSLSHTLGFVP